MSFTRIIRRSTGIFVATIALTGAGLASFWHVTAADHTDGPLATGDQAADIADVYAFSNGDNLVLAMTISNVQAAPAIELGRSIFDPEVLYQFKIDSNDDAVEDLVIQVFATGNPRNQVMKFTGPVQPDVVGTTARIVNGPATSVRVSTGANPIIAEKDGMKVFAGVRDDPFFFDLAQFLAILNGNADGFLEDGNDTFAGLNVYAIVVELPLSALGGSSESLKAWGTTHRL